MRTNTVSDPLLRYHIRPEKVREFVRLELRFFLYSLVVLDFLLTYLDMLHIRNWTIWLDIQLSIQTIPVVLSRKGAY